MKKIITGILVILFLTTTQAQQEIVSEPVTVEIGSLHKIQSSILNEERNLLIHLPNDYKNSEKKYPVIYVLDGDNHFQHTSNASTLLAENERMPESIIVAIPNNQGTRNRDLARERDKFKQYIKDEVIPFVEKNYRTTNHKTIFGHSMAGAFVLNYLATESSLFDNYIAASPVIQILDSELHGKFNELFKTEKALNKSLYFTLADEAAEGERATNALKKFVEILKNEAPKSLDWKYNFIENQVHMTTPYLTMYEGLSKVFADYQSPRYSSYEDFKNRGGLNALKTYYSHRADKYQTSKEIPNRTLRRVAYVLLDDGQTDMAINLFEENIKKYPQSAIAHKALGDAYEENNEIKKALKAHQTAVNLSKEQNSPDTNYFSRQLIRVQTKLKN
ncbi:Ferri-bacillibactin esterase BesA [Kordia antarctica]|uniref:Ferri-bacillibactin esterase BesA n=1 Tax=Kordia antarctica TaxID=1218801 RepID=A0A7L4ZJA1_9FLAO|nr:alpha/beta hydrolase-fold protein [Kordia antarctica]QHI36557.1 Ferri-bacillibactin esterase BesA [Kordia antarctica]